MRAMIEPMRSGDVGAKKSTVVALTSMREPNSDKPCLYCGGGPSGVPMVIE